MFSLGRPLPGRDARIQMRVTQRRFAWSILSQPASASSVERLSPYSSARDQDFHHRRFDLEASLARCWPSSMRRTSARSTRSSRTASAPTAPRLCGSDFLRTSYAGLVLRGARAPRQGQVGSRKLSATRPTRSVCRTTTFGAAPCNLDFRDGLGENLAGTRDRRRSPRPPRGREPP